MVGGKVRERRKRGRRGEEWSEEEGEKASIVIQFIKVSLSIGPKALKTCAQLHTPHNHRSCCDLS